MALIGLRLVTGVMGGGKSYAMAEFILKALKEGAQVHTNLDLNYDEVKKRGFESQVVDLRNLDVKKDMKAHIRAGDESRPNLLCLDEAALFFYVDDQNSQDERANNKDVLQFLTWARRFGLEIYFATQSAKNINVKLRRMSEYTIRCTNSTQIPYFGWLFTMLFGEFRRHIYLTDEDKEILFTKQSARFSKEVGDFYFTHGFAGQQDKQGIVMNKVITRKIPKRIDQRNGKIMIGAFVSICCFTVWFLYHLIMSFLHGDASSKQKAVAADTKKADPMRTAAFVSRVPHIVIWTTKGETFAPGVESHGKKVKFIADYGKWFTVTFHDNTTENILAPKPS